MLQPTYPDIFGNIRPISIQQFFGGNFSDNNFNKINKNYKSTLNLAKEQNLYCK